jgi:hypothetical protein
LDIVGRGGAPGSPRGPGFVGQPFARSFMFGRGSRPEHSLPLLNTQTKQPPTRSPGHTACSPGVRAARRASRGPAPALRRGRSTKWILSRTPDPPPVAAGPPGPPRAHQPPSPLPESHESMAGPLALRAAHLRLSARLSVCLVEPWPRWVVHGKGPIPDHRPEPDPGSRSGPWVIRDAPRGFARLARRSLASRPAAHAFVICHISLHSIMRFLRQSSFAACSFTYSWLISRPLSASRLEKFQSRSACLVGRPGPPGTR